MKKIISFMGILLVICLYMFCRGQLAGIRDKNDVLKITQQTSKEFNKQITKIVKLRYLVYLPEKYLYNKRKKWPLILFLHGSAVGGDDLEMVRNEGLALYIDQKRDFPFVVVSPQCPEVDHTWLEHLIDVNALLDEIVVQYQIDTTRIYLTGLSNGGQATWRMAIDYPHRFAAIAPIAGKSYPWRASQIQHVPVWVFHGAKDDSIPFTEAQKMVDALEKVNAEVKFTLYPDLNHNCWTRTYRNEELYKWFLKHKLYSK